MDIEIREVKSKKDLKNFIDFQYSLYKNNKFWVPPLKRDEYHSLLKNQNPAFEFCEAKYWLAYKNEKIVGRIAGIINNKYNEIWDKKVARFGWFDFIDDSEVAAKLLRTVENWAKEKNLDTVNGPLGFTDMDAEGSLVEGFEELSTYGALYNYRYYPLYIEKSGYKKESDWVEFEVTITPKVDETVKRISEIALKRNNLHVLEVKNSKEFLPYAKEIFQVLNDTYKNLFGFVELSERQIDDYVKQYFGFVLPEYLPVVLDENNKVAAFGITMPSLSKAMQKSKGRLFPFGFIHVLKAMKRADRVDLYLTGVRPDLQNKGVNAILMYQINKMLVKNKIKKVETNRELENNLKIQAQWKFFETRLHKRRRCYSKTIES